MTDSAYILSLRPERRRALLEAKEEKDRIGFVPKRHGGFGAFMKMEAFPGYDRSTPLLERIEFSSERLIQAPHDVAHLYYGPEVKPFGEQLKYLWSLQGKILYGAQSPEVLDQFLQERLAVGARKRYFWSDFSMFDRSHSDSSWSFIAKLYFEAGVRDPNFWAVFDAWLRPSGRCGPMRYKADTMNASGRDDTALANAILNGFATVMSITAAWYGISIFQLTAELISVMLSLLALSVCGDDSIFALPEPIPSGFETRLAENFGFFGFEAKIFSSERLVDAVYLGMRPLRVAGVWYWHRTLGRALYKLGWCVHDKDCDLFARQRGIADMHCRISRHTPVLFEWAKATLRCLPTTKITLARADPNKPWQVRISPVPDYTADTLIDLAAAYSVGEVLVTVDDIMGLLKTINAVRCVPAVVDHWLLRHFCLVDDA